MAAKSSIELILNLRDRMQAGLNKAKSNVTKTADQIKSDGDRAGRGLSQGINQGVESVNADLKQLKGQSDKLINIKTKVTGLDRGTNKVNSFFQSLRQTVSQTTQTIKSKASGAGQTIKEKITGGIKGVFPSIEQFQLKHGDMFNAMKSEVPFIGRFAELLANPYVLAGAAVVALTAGVIKLGSHLVEVTNDIHSNQVAVQSTFGITGDQLKDTTAQIMAISDVVGVETKELRTAANALQKEYQDSGLSIRDSLDLVKVGLQATNSELDINNIREYATQAKAAGLSAENFVGVLALSRREGIFDDKGIDTIKEFSLRIKEMTPAADKALKGLGLSSKEILKNLDNGSMTTLDVLRRVSERMGAVGTQARQTAIADLFAGSGEDAGERFLLSLAKADFSVKGITQGMENVIAFQNQQIHLNERIRQQQSRFATILQPFIKQWTLIELRIKEVFYGTMADVVEFWKHEFDKVRPIYEGLFAGFKVVFDLIRNQVSRTVTAIGYVIRVGNSLIRGIHEAIKFTIEMIGQGVRWIGDQINGLYNFLGGKGNLWEKLFGKIEFWSFKIKVFFEDISRFGTKSFELFEAVTSRDLVQASRLMNELKAFQFRDANILFQAQAASSQPPASGASMSNSSVSAGTKEPATTPLVGGVSSPQQVRNLTINIGAVHRGDIVVDPDDQLEGMSPEETGKHFHTLVQRVFKDGSLAFN